MSFTRKKYDTSNTRHSLAESMKSGHYQIGGPKKCNPCFQPNPSIRIQKSGVERFNGATADIESKLHGTTSSPDNYTLQNQCDGIDSQYSCVHGVHGVHGVGNDFSQINQMQTCFLPTENTRLSNPASNLRGSGINRFNPLCLDPQKGVIFGAQYDIPTRMIAKDTFRPCVPTPSINNMLPEQKELPDFRTILNAPASFIGSLYKYDKCG